MARDYPYPDAKPIWENAGAYLLVYILCPTCGAKARSELEQDGVWTAVCHGRDRTPEQEAIHLLKDACDALSPR